MVKRRSTTRARVREDADRGIHEIVELMASGHWVTGASHERIAKKHGVSPATVKNWATTASRVLRSLLEEDSDNLRARLVATLDVVVHRALSPKGADLRAATMAIGEQAKLLGLQSSKLDVKHSGAMLGMTREQHLQALNELKAEIAAEEIRIREEQALP